MVKESWVRDEAELKVSTVLLVQYMSRVQEVRSRVDWKEVEEVIVNDFINLDSCISHIN